MRLWVTGSKIFSWLLLGLFCSVFASRFSISTDQLTFAQLEENESFVCSGPRMRADFEQVAYRPDYWIIRFKTSSGTYQLCQGLPREGVLSNLETFTVAGGNLQEKLTNKYYTRPNDPDWDKDIEVIALDSNHLYALTQSNLFFKRRGGWKRLESGGTKPAMLFLQTLPDQATLYLQGKEIGKTPYSTIVPYTTQSLVRLKLKGFYDVEKWVKVPQSYELIDLTVLTKKIHAPTLEEMQVNLDSLSPSCDSTLFHLQQMMVLDELARLEGEWKNQREKFLERYPKFSLKSTEESNATYQERVQNYNQQKQSDLKAFILEQSLQAQRIFKIQNQLNLQYASCIPQIDSSGTNISAVSTKDSLQSSIQKKAK